MSVQRRANIGAEHLRFGILPAGKLMRAPAVQAGNGFMLQLIEPELEVEDDGRERLQRIGSACRTCWPR